MQKDFIFTSESATEGHPDKICDQISDAVVDRFLEEDPYSVVRAECAVANGVLFLASRFSSRAKVDFARVARKVIDKIGYVQPDFNSKTCSILTSLKELPPDEHCCFDAEALSEAAINRIHVRQQGTFFGFACNQTPSLMPLPIYLAHKLAMKLDAARHQQALPYVAPDGKTQVGIEYRDRRPYRIHSVSIATTLDGASSPAARQVHDDIRDLVITAAFQDEPIGPDAKTHVNVNPEGVTMVGGPSVHSGLTGRKNATDTYGEYSRYSGSALSGKDPLRIDRVGVYAARYAAKNIVAAGLAAACEVQLSYALAFPGPVSIQVDTFDTGKVDDHAIASLLKNHFDFRLAGIIRQFDLRLLPSKTKDGFYRRLATYGHVGRTDLDLPWERTDKASLLAAQ
jgi:S-adenosylmethionine synthetase